MSIPGKQVLTSTASASGALVMLDVVAAFLDSTP
jgi:hypothetical protein